MIIKTEISQIQTYTEDESGLGGGFAHKVYVPENENEVAEVLKECTASKTPVTVSGGGTGVTASGSAGRRSAPQVRRGVRYAEGGEVNGGQAQGLRYRDAAKDQRR